ncbi:PH domain-containing protein [Pseudogracilibacillus auburnensis]|uniref:PH (Pleckstrin Homology) domain-containing protein n=1 Tax=Pseudogracilibacillus auburnensis TaxID=1494959 RepID=A0A2V3VFB6_9BACI|nr:PH domain-containing protein [Pseudogracilibacillus auburnensis]MBO1002487.1 PH domain-containing protein [Pseudogracilibacillus auburnensis]PXW80437.1 PH (Pleckstrin Homology) domain-containing protein [Pseudogracilibacillus auburnensis]
MVFRSEIDTFFIRFMLIVVLIIGVATFWPLFLEGGKALPVIIILTSIFLIVISFILWSAFSVKYVFYQDYLFVKGGPFRSRIQYEQITKVSPTTEIFTGYRILSSRDGLEIFYKTAALGSVKISPKDKKEFINEIKERCPNVKVQE